MIVVNITTKKNIAIKTTLSASINQDDISRIQNHGVVLLPPKMLKETRIINMELNQIIKMKFKSYLFPFLHTNDTKSINYCLSSLLPPITPHQSTYFSDVSDAEEASE